MLFRSTNPSAPSPARCLSSSSPHDSPNSPPATSCPQPPPPTTPTAPPTLSFFPKPPRQASPRARNPSPRRGHGDRALDPQARGAALGQDAPATRPEGCRFRELGGAPCSSVDLQWRRPRICTPLLPRPASTPAFFPGAAATTARRSRLLPPLRRTSHDEQQRRRAAATTTRRPMLLSSPDAAEDEMRRAAEEACRVAGPRYCSVGRGLAIFFAQHHHHHRQML